MVAIYLFLLVVCVVVGICGLGLTIGGLGQGLLVALGLVGSHLVLTFRREKSHRFWRDLWFDIEVELQLDHAAPLWRRIAAAAGSLGLMIFLWTLFSVGLMSMGLSGSMAAWDALVRADNAKVLASAVREEIELCDDFGDMRLPLEVVQYALTREELLTGPICPVEVRGPEARWEGPTAFFSRYGDYNILVDWVPVRFKRPWEDTVPMQLQIFIWNRGGLVPDDVIPHFKRVQADWIPYQIPPAGNNV